MDGSKMDGVHAIDVNKLITSMTRKQASECSVSAIQELAAKFPLIPILNRHEKVDKPPVITVGPYHHMTRTTVQIEKLKWDALSYILQINPKRKLRDYIVGMEEVEQQIRSCYANEIKMSSDDFLRMMLLDGCFILYTLYGMEGANPTEDCTASDMDVKSSILNQSNSESNIHIKLNQERVATNVEHIVREDNTYTRKWYTTYFSHDLLLLENQIPFFVVKKIYEIVTEGVGSRSLLIENIADFTKYLIDSYPKRVLQFDTKNDFHHLLHLCHMYFKPGQVIGDSDQDYSTSVSYQLHHSVNDTFNKTGVHSTIDESGSSLAFQELPGWHRASEYHKGGIDFRKRETCIDGPHSLLDIGFYDGVLEMPRITIDKNTHRLFQNLIAFEQTSPQVGNYMTAYVVFLSQLVSEAEDVSLLAKRGIILHELESDAEVSEVFRLLAEGVDFNPDCNHYLECLCSRMEGHYQIRRSRWRGWLGSITSSIPTLTSGSSSESDQFPEELSAERHV